MTRPTPPARDVAVRTGTLAGRPVEVAVPAAATGATVLYLHGGGFCIGSPGTHRALTTHLAAATGATAHVLDYRLAPEHPFPAALDDAVAAWRELVAGGAERSATALTGDSAGGWLVLSAALRLRADGDPGAPRFAPLTADLSGLPPMAVHAGSEEILLDDAVELAVRARAAGVPVDLRRWEGLWHVAQASAGLVAASTAAVAEVGTRLAGFLAVRSAQR